MTDRDKAKLTTWLIERRRQGEAWPLITEGVIESIMRASPLPVHKRADRLLAHLNERTVEIGAPLHAPFQSEFAYAVSESISFLEVNFLRSFLFERGWLVHKRAWSGDDAALTVDGLARVEEISLNPNSNQAFVAMWIHPSTDSAYFNGIEPAIKECGFSAMRIDQKNDVGKIDDEIVAEIRRSNFIVADFTQDDGGARGSVYFEAGFAMGLGIPVVFTCHKDWIGELHFDTRQYAHLSWDTPETLRELLVARISARLGDRTLIPN
ncbi:MAG: hypothetical protein F4Y67_01080 [Chloroflexi bacterium]|nr:hypothetical protein [Chloroflexota bacterium]